MPGHGLAAKLDPSGQIADFLLDGLRWIWDHTNGRSSWEAQFESPKFLNDFAKTIGAPQVKLKLNASVVYNPARTQLTIGARGAASFKWPLPYEKLAWLIGVTIPPFVADILRPFVEFSVGLEGRATSTGPANLSGAFNVSFELKIGLQADLDAYIGDAFAESGVKGGSLFQIYPEFKPPTFLSIAGYIRAGFEVDLGFCSLKKDWGAEIANKVPLLD